MPHPIERFAREAYAAGWASTDGPLTDRVRAGCIAAVRLAVVHADDPHVLEATLHLGRLEGTWAAVYGRREKLHVANVTAVAAAWAAFGLRAVAGDLVRAARSRAGLTEAAGADDWYPQLVRGVFAQNLNVTDVHGLADALHGALLQAQAEGRAGAAALLAQQHDLVGFDFNIAFNDAYRALQGASSLATTAEVDGWLSRLLGGNADEVGAKLATMTRAGASYEEMAAAVGGILDGASSRAVAAGVDVLTSRALSRGALDLYRVEGVQWVDYLTAGDGRVCPVCTALEKKNPYRIENAPLSGQHPFCRCAVSPSEQSVASLMAGTTLPGFGTVAADVAAAGEIGSALTFEGRIAAALEGEAALSSVVVSMLNREGREYLLSSDEMRAFGQYRGASYNETNRGLRGTFGAKLDAETRHLVRVMDKALRRSALDHDVVVWRGAAFRKEFFGDRFNGDLTGFTWREKAYSSTSASRRQATFFAGGEHPVLMRLLLPKGQLAVQLSGTDAEWELLLQRNLKFRVVADRGFDPGRGYRLLDVEIAP